MTHVTCRLTASILDQLRNPTLGNRAWALFTFYFFYVAMRHARCGVLLAVSHGQCVCLLGTPCRLHAVMRSWFSAISIVCLYHTLPHLSFFFTFSLLILVLWIPSVLWLCWLGGRNGIRPVKKLWVVGCWHGYLSGAKCRLAYDPCWCHCHSLSCVSKIQIGFSFLVPAHLVVPEKGPLNGCVCVCVFVPYSFSPLLIFSWIDLLSV